MFGIFKKVGKYLALRAIPIIRDNLVLKAKTVSKEDGFYLNIYMEAFGVTIVDTDLLLSSAERPNTSKKVLTLDDPIDVVRTNQLDPFDDLDKIAKERTEQ